jgi:hypothetical protein
MGLNISNGGGEDFVPFLKYNAKAGRWYVRKDENDVEINNPTFVIDFDNIKTGWFLFEAGIPPSIAFDKDLSTPAAKPSEKHKRGFEVNVFSKSMLDGVRVFSSTSGIVGSSINAIYEQYEKEKAANNGSLPVVQCAGVTPEVGKHGTNYKPNLSIVKWTSRPAEFDAINTNAPAPQVAPASIPSSGVSEF